jgi:hypothetical protein
MLNKNKVTPQLAERFDAQSAVALTDKQKLSIYKKSQKSGYPVDILEEVYRRGVIIWEPELSEGTKEQFAFDRVNSFISGGVAAELDSDLIDEGNGLWANIHAKRKRGERMRKPGEKGAPTKEAIKAAQNEEIEYDFDLDLEESAGLAKKSKASGVSLSVLRKVYNRGMAAWRTGHRPGTTPQQWGMARVNSYITKGKGTYHGADKDLREASLPEVPKDKETGLPKKYTTGEISTDRGRAAHFAKGREKHWDDPSAYGKAPGDATAKTKESKHTKKYKEMYGEETECDCEYCTAERQSTDPNDSSSRFMGTDSLVNIYKSMTPGQSNTLKAIKDVVKEAREPLLDINEAEYKGKKVTLNKPFRTPGGPKKSAVYVDPDGDGKAKIVRFGDPNLSIKKHRPARKRSYCARSSGQGNLTKKDSANYWSRRAWDC